MRTAGSPSSSRTWSSRAGYRPDPVALMAASLVCDDMVVASTDAFPVSQEGDGRISDRIGEIDDCDDPIVLVRSATSPDGLGNYFAVAAADD